MEVIVKSSPKIEIELATKVVKVGGGDFDAEGNYPLLHVGTADDLAGRGESVPASFGFRASGGKSIKDGRAYIKRIKGNSVVWNQLRSSANRISYESIKGGLSVQYNRGESMQSITGTYEGFNGDPNWYNAGAFNAIEGVIGHKYLCSIRGNENILMTVYGYGGSSLLRIKDSVIFTAQTATGINIVPSIDVSMAIGTVVNENIFFLCHDLTKMFGAGNEPTTIEEFYARIPMGVDLNAYNEGQVIHCNTESIKSVGDNAWDEEWRNGHYASTTGVYNNSSQSVCNVNPIKVLPNQEYYNTRAADGYIESYAFFYDADMNFISYASMGRGTFTTPANSAYMNFYFSVSYYGTTYKNDIMITLVHSGWKQDTDAGYQPYWQDTLPLPIIRKYFPDGMKSAGSAHDEIRYNKASGKWEYSKGRMKNRDLGSLKWYVDSTKGFFKTDIDEVIGTNYLCAKYMPITYQQLGVDVGINCVDLGGGKSQVQISDTSYTDAASFKAMLQEKQVILYYESNDWEWVELDAEDQNFRDYYNVADFGTEMSQSSVPSAPFSADIIYQFNAVDMIRENYNEIEKIKAALAKAGITIDL